MVGEGCEMKGFGEECSVEERGRRWFGEGRNGCAVVTVPAITLLTLRSGILAPPADFERFHLTKERYIHFRTQYKPTNTESVDQGKIHPSLDFDSNLNLSTTATRKFNWSLHVVDLSSHLFSFPPFLITALLTLTSSTTKNP